METLIVIVGLMLVTVIVLGVGERTNLPWPVLLTLLSTATMVVPAIPDISLPPELILPLFLPPLLWAMARKLSWPLIRANWRTLLSMSVLLVIITILAVTWTSLVLIPGISVAGAIALAAAVAPPDPVAVEAVAEPAGIPRRIIGTLQTEGLFNDAVALVAFQLALGMLQEGKGIGVWSTIGQFFWAAAVAAVLGWVIGYLAGRALDYTTDSTASNALSWVIPFAAYIGAEELHASGVIAVVVAAIEMTSRVSANASEDRLTGQAFWHTAELLITGLAFGLIGLSVRNAVEQSTTRIGDAIIWGVVISLVAFVVRFVWMYAAYLLNRRSKRINTSPLRLQEVLVLTWSGMRGLVTLALVLSIPAGYVSVYNEMPLIAITVLFCTMVIPGLTLPWLMQKLDLETGAEGITDATTSRLLRRANDAAMDVIHSRSHEIPTESVAGLARRFRDITGIPEISDGDDYDDARAKLNKLRQAVADVRREAIEAAQVEVMSARFEPGVDPHIVDDILRQLDRMLLASTSSSEWMKQIK
ncbi:MAG: sodium:proton antiporter [Bifidobacterium sp.]|nr:sodium:proton antiporter [Bifidobacterium sp.]